MRDLILTLVIFGALPVALMRPWIGVLLWSWISYMNPHRLTWGFAYNMPFVKLVSLATLSGLLLSREAKPLPRTATTLLLFVFWSWLTLTTFLANYPQFAWPEWERASKIILLAIVTMLLFQDVKRIRYLVLIIALSHAYFGAKSGVAGLLSGFSSRLYAYPEDSFIQDNNDLALALNMSLPLLLLFAWEERRPLFKGAFYAITGLTLLGVLSTFSRGGFLGLAIIIATLALRSRRKVLNLTFVIFTGLVVASALSTSWYDRISSISEYGEDSSAQGRLQAWEVSTKLAFDSPITGGGFRTLQPEIYWRYGHDDVRKEIAAHSIYFQVLGEQGFVGLGIFLALIGLTFFSLRQVAQMAPLTATPGELQNLSVAIQTSLIAFIVSGAFLSRAYFEIVYQLIAISAVLRKLAGERLAEERITTVAHVKERGVAVIGRPVPGRLG